MKLPNQEVFLVRGGAVGQEVAVMAWMGPEHGGALSRASLSTHSE